MERNSVICVCVCVFPGVACCCTVGGLAGFGLLFVFPVSHALKEFLIPQEYIFQRNLKHVQVFCCSTRSTQPKTDEG